MASTPRLALLIDVDGPLSHLDHKRIEEPTIVDSLRALVDGEVPVILNTGRAAAFVQRQVIDVVERNLYAVCEKGAVWFRSGEALQLDEAVATPHSLNKAIERSVEDFADFVFFDTDKLAMISIERGHGVSADEYAKVQPKLLAGMKQLVPDEFVISEEAIAIDVQSPKLGKDLGAQRAMAMLREDGIEPKEWRTIGDSDGDYAMADWLHAQGEVVKHVDVRGVGERRDYPVLIPQTAKLDTACAEYLRWVLEPTLFDLENGAQGWLTL